MGDKQPQQVFAIPEGLLQATLQVLQTELPMAKVRGLVQALEAAQPVMLQEKEPEADA